MENNNKYVVMVEGRNTPTKIWNDYDLAQKEAERLCKKEQLTVYVCVAITKVELGTVTITSL